MSAGIADVGCTAWPCCCAAAPLHFSPTLCNKPAAPLPPLPPPCRSGCPSGLGFNLVLNTIAPNAYYWIAVSPRLATGWTGGLQLSVRRG